MSIRPVYFVSYCHKEVLLTISVLDTGTCLASCSFSRMLVPMQRVFHRSAFVCTGFLFLRQISDSLEKAPTHMKLLSAVTRLCLQPQTKGIRTRTMWVEERIGHGPRQERRGFSVRRRIAHLKTLRVIQAELSCCLSVMRANTWLCHRLQAPGPTYPQQGDRS